MNARGETVPLSAGCVEIWWKIERRAEKSVGGETGIARATAPFEAGVGEEEEEEEGGEEEEENAGVAAAEDDDDSAGAEVDDEGGVFASALLALREGVGGGASVFDELALFDFACDVGGGVGNVLGLREIESSSACSIRSRNGPQKYSACMTELA